jgi:hypothetical protein
MGDRGSAYRFLVERSEEKIPLGRPTRRWDDDIIMDLKEVETRRHGLG